MAPTETVSSSAPVLPDFVVVGAMKAATTTLKNHLIAHPDVHMASDEIHFFNNDANFERGLTWYSKHFETTEPVAIRGEKTPGYHCGTQVPERMAACIPLAKLVWVLRDPIRRATSHYWYAMSRGWEFRSMKKVFEGDLQHLEKDVFRQFVRRGDYAAQISNFLEFFPRQQQGFFFFEHLVKDPNRVLDDLCEFLEVPSIVGLARPNHTTNRTNGIPILPHAQWLAHRTGLLQRPLVGKIIKRLNTRRLKRYPPAPRELVEQLQDFYAPRVRRLLEIIGLEEKNLPWSWFHQT